MSHDTLATGRMTGARTDVCPTLRLDTETAASSTTTGLTACVLAVLAVLVGAAATDVSGFGAPEACLSITLLAIGHLVSRGLATSGSRDRSALARP